MVGDWVHSKVDTRAEKKAWNRVGQKAATMVEMRVVERVVLRADSWAFRSVGRMAEVMVERLVGKTDVWMVDGSVLPKAATMVVMKAETKVVQMVDDWAD